MFFKIRLRLTLLTVGIVLFLYSLLSIAVWTIVHQLVDDNIDKRLSRALIRFAQQHGYVNPIPTGDYIWIESGNYTYSNTPPYLMDAFRRVIRQYGAADPFSMTFHDSVSGLDLRLLYIPQLAVQANSGSGFGVIATDFSRELIVLNRLRVTLILVGAGGGVVATLAGFFLADRFLRPIRLSWQRQTDFVADASHEMRTPLSVIQANLGLVMEHTHQTVDENLEWINNAMSEARRLSKLVQDLLTLARADTETIPIERTPVCISDVVLQVVDLFDPIMVAREIQLNADVTPGLMMVGDRDRLHQLMVILFDNASKFTPPGGKVDVVVNARFHTVYVEITDTGCGIPPNELPRVFDRFYRADPARHHGAQGGAGLGLAIAKWIVHSHQGKIHITSEVAKGTTVLLSFPM
jgi:two-component system, OmpR family, sensor histidine kinase CiaH